MKCWFIQKTVSLFLDDNRHHGGWVQRHLDRCAACQQYVQTHIRLGQALRLQAADRRETASPFLKTRVLASVAAIESARPVHPGRSLPHRAGLWTAATALASLLAAGLLWWDRQPAASRSEPMLTTELLRQGTHQLAKLSTLELPLDKEVGYVINDAKTALLAVADSVLPASLLER